MIQSNWFRMSFVPLAVACACSSARMDPNTGTVNWSAPPPLPLARPSASSSAAPAPEKAPQLGENSAAPAASAQDKAPEPTVCSSLPDPVPTTTDRWIKLQVRLDRGEFKVLSFARERMRRPQSTKRVMGRFAAELWIGCELIDRLRFEFPLLAAEPSTLAPQDVNFERASRFDVTILVPDSERATRLELVDRAHDMRRRFDWPLRAEQMDKLDPTSAHQ